ncbi:hypothetical protein AB4Z40_35125 [Bosea sp. 2YAB26]|uniref:TackOD1 domain-containing metal-binding protein n=1 Tax=Bosea sp. 2YAB26 TaxID=3237478 RepID=UPI003F8DD9BB
MTSPPLPDQCDICRSGDVERHRVIHHMICAYIGPEYDFARSGDERHCPKCRRRLLGAGRDWEVVAASLQCRICRREIVVPEVADPNP